MKSAGTSQSNVSRRGFLGGAIALATLAGAGCSGTSGSPSGSIRVDTYGNPEKVKRAVAVINAFGKTKPKLKVTPEGLPSAQHSDKIATEMAAGNAPDVLRLGLTDVAQYLGKGAVAPLDSYVGNELDTSGFNKNLLAEGRFNGKLYAVPIAIGIQAIGYDTTALQKVGIKLPTGEWTYDDYSRIALDIRKAGGPSLYGSSDNGGRLDSLELFLRSRGEKLYNGNKIGFPTASLSEWLNIWVKLRANGGCVPADVTAQFTGTNWQDSALVQKKCAIAAMYSNDFQGGYQGLTSDKLALRLPPSASKNGNPGHYPGPTSVLSLNKRSKSKKTAVECINFFVNTAQAAKLLGVISGPPASKVEADAIEHSKSLSKADKQVLDYVQSAQQSADAAPPIAPTANTDVSDLLMRTNQNIGFGKQKLSAAVSDFMTQAKSLLEKG